MQILQPLTIPTLPYPLPHPPSPRSFQCCSRIKGHYSQQDCPCPSSPPPRTAGLLSLSHQPDTLNVIFSTDSLAPPQPALPPGTGRNAAHPLANCCRKDEQGSPTKSFMTLVFLMTVEKTSACTPTSHTPSLGDSLLFPETQH